MIKKFIIAVIGSPFGIDGFVKVRSMSGEIEHLLELQEVTIRKDGKEQLLKVEEAKASPLAMRFKGYDTPEKTKTLSGAQLLAGREQAAPLKEGEFYIEDLKGIEVVTKEGEVIGHITDIVEGGGGELAEINLQCTMHNAQCTMHNENTRCSKNNCKLKPQPLSSSVPQSLRLVPFRKEFFPEISPEKGRIIIDNLWVLE